MPHDGDFPSLGLSDMSDTKEEESGHAPRPREEEQT